MRLLDILPRRDVAPAPARKSFAVEPVNGDPYGAIARAMLAAIGERGTLTADAVWSTQPNVRGVVEFLASNFAQLGLHTYKRVSDTDRERVTGSPVSRLLARPAPLMTSYDLVYAIVADLLLFDEALILVVRSKRDEGWTLRPVPVGAIVGRGGSQWDSGGVWFDVQVSDDADPVRFTGDQVVWIGGYTPGHTAASVPRVVTLADELREQLRAAEFRAQMWKSGMRTSQIITRPADAKWSSEARAQFLADLRSYADRGENVGRPLLLEDGMTTSTATFNARDAQWLESVQLSLSTVCRIFQVSPAMVGSTGGVTYANMREFRKMLFGETLGPIKRRIEDALNAFLLPKLGAEAGTYVEFNFKEKLAGSFSEEAAILATSTGAPFMTRNEARATQNLPWIDGGDDLVTPLNMQVGAAPPDDGDDEPDAEPRGMVPGSPKSRRGRGRVKAPEDDDDEHVRAVADALARVWDRQAAELGDAGPGDAITWDAKRWDDALAAELYDVAMAVTAEIGAATLADLGVSPDLYDVRATGAFLLAVAESRAAMINAATLERVESLADWTPPEGEPDAEPPKARDVLADVQRKAATVAALVTTFRGFATVEAGQRASSDATKTWNTGPNARADHARMDGETVGVREKFSNGADWPGDPVLGADGVAGCNCGVTVEIP